METNASLLKASMDEKLEDDTLGRYEDYTERKIRETPRSGSGYKTQNWSEDGERIITREILGKNHGVEFAPVIPAAFEYDRDGRIIWVLSPYDYHQVCEGRVCHACLEWQEEAWTPKCAWRGKNGDGCGASRRAINELELRGRL